MNCNEAAPLLPTYGDGELAPMQSAAVEKHLLACAECAARREEQPALSARIKRDVPYFAAPPSMRSRIDAVLAGGPPTTPHPPAPGACGPRGTGRRAPGQSAAPGRSLGRGGAA